MSIYISEIFGPTIQGEGSLIGQPTVFVRVGGCDYRCSWCDSNYAVKSKYKNTWKRMTIIEILSAIKSLTNGQSILVTISGGNPAIYDFSDLIKLGHVAGFTFAMETQGSIVKSYFADLDYLIVSPKPPSAKINFAPIKLKETLAMHTSPILKIVVADDNDYNFAKSIHKEYANIPMILQPCNLQTKEGDDVVDFAVLQSKLKWLIAKTIQDGLYKITILPQLHVLLWNNQRKV